jgi:peptide chain release factor subunit 1
MAAKVGWETLRDLARFRAEKGLALSFYLGLDPSVTPTAADADTRFRSLFHAGERQAAAGRGELTHEQRAALKADFERIRRWFDEEFDRDGARGLAIFSASLDNFWAALPLADATGDEVKLGHEFYVAPLVPLVGKGEGAIVAFVSRERGNLYQLGAGRLHEVVDLSDDVPGRHDQGGWSQARFQRHIDAQAAGHVRRVADELNRRVRRNNGAPVIVAAPEETRAELEGMLTQEARAALAGWATAEAHATPAELLDAALPILDEWHARRERELLDRWREEAGRNGRATGGWTATLEAASDGRVELLLFDERANRAAWQCPSCGRAATASGSCPLDGTRMEPREDGLDLAVHQTLAHGGALWALRFGSELDTVEGIAALLRF